MNANRSLRAVVSTSALGIAGLALADVPTYSNFEIQARSNIVDGYNLPASSSFNSKTPSLNNEGTIAFSLVSVGGANAGLFVGAGGVGGVVYNAPPERGIEDPIINNLGNVAFEQFDFFSEGLFIFDAQAKDTTLVHPPFTYSGASVGGFADDGTIGFRASTASSVQTWRTFNGGETIFVGEGGDIAFLFDCSSNASGQIAGKMRFGSTSGSAPDEIRRYDAPGVFTIMAQDDDADPKSPFSGFDNSAEIADDGSVAFVASLNTGGRGVFRSDGKTITEIATTNDDMVSDILFFPPNINANGLVVFRGEDQDGLDAIFVGDGTTLRRVIGREDTFEIDLGLAQINQHNDSIAFGGAVAINDHGDIAFNAALTPADNNQIEWGSGMIIAYADEATTPGDLNSDGFVDTIDLLQLLGEWGDCPAKGNCTADLNDDGIVDTLDLLALLGNWT